MSEKMTIVFVKETGHVVAALTRATDPEATIAPDVLAGDALVVRYVGLPTAAGYSDSAFLIQPDQLDVLIPDFDEDKITNPRGFFVDPDQQVKPVNSVNAVGATFPSVAQIQVTVAVAVTQESKIWVQIVDPATNERQIVTGKIAAGATNVSLNLSPLDPTTNYDVLALVVGYAPHRLIHATP
jgi:hypothetical protein